MSDVPDHHSDVEKIKRRSRHLRGTIVQGLADMATGALAADDTQLTKFHGFYQQDDRELRAERKLQKLEPHYQFMLRMRLPGGCLTPQQWLALDAACRAYGESTMRITTRQTFQFHRVLKKDLKPMMQAIHHAGLDTRGGCGDVNRNVVATANPHRSRIHAQVYDWAQKISEHLLWRSRAYDEIWLDAPASDVPEHEPLYGDSYLPRKFKVALAIPPENDCDVLANDIALIAIVENGELQGFNVGVGGGMGASYGIPSHYPRLASIIGFCTQQQLLAVVEQIVGIQRDHGDRSDRMHARFKYTIDEHGLEWVKTELAQRLGQPLAAARPYHFSDNGDHYGWLEGDDGLWHLSLFIENGRLADFADFPLLSAMREVAAEMSRQGIGEIRLSCNQNLILARIPVAHKDAIDALARRLGLLDGLRHSALRRASMACVALPTCGLAMAEAERYLPDLIGKLDLIMRDLGLEDTTIVTRMTGCPNGCARPYLGEIAFTGKAPGKYNVYLGAAHNGERLNKLYRENIAEEDILAALRPLLERYARERDDGEPFGDFVVRAGIINATLEGRQFHEQVLQPKT
ncbi:MAG: assimilatory sulfite reductase (NADPH) hemoprotein subunit [Pseudomonadales bacterium]|nr:assimilatory sulfite reductase (NADPH) hemoprotein subunit [Pseudomonadales bacterium]